MEGVIEAIYNQQGPPIVSFSIGKLYSLSGPDVLPQELVKSWSCEIWV